MQIDTAARMVHSTAPVRPDFAEILGRVRKLRPDIEQRALGRKKPSAFPPKPWTRCATRTSSA
ncbi:MAG: hypothetical protein ACLP19_00165 [Xanthobacteraceae bacterium]